MPVSGFAFVDFSDYQDASDAVARLDGTKIAGTRYLVILLITATIRTPAMLWQGWMGLRLLEPGIY